MKTKSKKGFTLIEMLIVVAIIGLLATVVLFAVARARKKAVATQMKAHVEEMMKAVEMAATDGVTAINIHSGASMVNPSDVTIVYIQRVPASPTCTGCSYTLDGTSIATSQSADASGYVLAATGFTGGDTFTCQNGSCYCSTGGGCLAIP